MRSALERIGEFGRRRETLGRVTRERTGEFVVELLGAFWRYFAKPGDGLEQQLIERIELGLAFEETPVREYFPEHDRGGEDIGATVDGGALGLLGRHVCELAFERARLRIRES